MSMALRRRLPVEVMLSFCVNLCPATLGHHERRVDEAFFFIQRTSVAIADVPFCSWDSFAAAYAITHLC